MATLYVTDDEGNRPHELLTRDGAQWQHLMGQIKPLLLSGGVLRLRTELA